MKDPATSAAATTSAEDFLAELQLKTPAQDPKGARLSIHPCFSLDQPATSAEVSVGGLTAETSEQAVKAAFSASGQVVGVKLEREHNKGCCKVGGRLVSVSMSNDAKQPDQVVADKEELPFAFDSDPDSSINKLLRLLRSHPNRKSAVAAALKAVETVPAPQANGTETALGEPAQPAASAVHEQEAQVQQTEPVKPQVKSPAADAAAGGEPAVSQPAAATTVSMKQKDKEREEEAPVIDLQQVLKGFPKCDHLMETFKNSPNTQNKTPLAVLHEYATRLSLELAYNESADTNLGPFNVEARLTSVGGAVLYATGSGKGRGKKDAKQVAAAAVLEMLLANVSETDFLTPGKAKQARNQPAISSTGLDCNPELKPCQSHLDEANSRRLDGPELSLLGESGAFGRMRGNRTARGLRGNGRGMRGLGPGMSPGGRMGMTPNPSPYHQGPRSNPHFMGGRGGREYDPFRVNSPIHMQSPLGQVSHGFGDAPGQKRNFASTMNMEMLGGGPPHVAGLQGGLQGSLQGGMAGMPPLGNMMPDPTGFPSNMQDMGMHNLYGQVAAPGGFDGMGPGPQGRPFDLSTGLDGGPIPGGYNPVNEAFPAGPHPQNFGHMPNQYNPLGSGY